MIVVSDDITGTGIYLVSFNPLLEALSTEVSALVSSILKPAVLVGHQARCTLPPQSLDSNILRTAAAADVLLLLLHDLRFGRSALVLKAVCSPLMKWLKVSAEYRGHVDLTPPGSTNCLYDVYLYLIRRKSSNTDILIPHACTDPSHPSPTMPLFSPESGISDLRWKLSSSHETVTSTT
ncbi:hypothetical protein BDP27DRAFT_1430677 [Rhodocollybia butyracea]|uniref:Uncharacterized protein n=1 Tax=Rhodocollybia butyracea TaxID=206335 RepID=A0A9P5TYM7_9AGAR|nr:hypothetical protein BDP27DRAFT_1430677 [Rhodocollybia butyracea]